MEGLDYWRLCDEFTVIQAALLIAGIDPAGHQEYVLGWEPHNRPSGFEAAFAALTHAIMAGRLRAMIRSKGETDLTFYEGFSIEERYTTTERGDVISFKIAPDWRLTTIALEDLQMWMRERGVRTGFFFPLETESADYLNSADEHYSPKLAAAIRAWEAVSRDPSTLRAKTVKQAIAVWLRRNANEYGLTKEDGYPNEQGIEEISKIANWDTKGGAPKTPGE